MSGRLTEGAYWDATYSSQSVPLPLDVRSFRRLNDRRIVELLQSALEPRGRVLEVGAGNSAVLTYLAAANPDAAFSGLDYSPSGCNLLRRRAELEKVAVEVLQQDLFDADFQPRELWDVVYSLGVVEHFAELASVLRAKARLLAPAGRIVTVIPNMAGLLGRLTRRWNPEVYALHVPHTIESLRNGHTAAGLRVLRSGYLCSTNFGVLSSCFPSDSGSGFGTYRWLSRVSTALWRVEHVTGDLPHSSFLSPYIFVVSAHER